MVQFSKIAPYLANPLVLIGFSLFLFFGIHRALLRARLLTPLSQGQSPAVIRLILRYGLSLAILAVVLGFVYAGFQAYHDTSRQRVQQGPITQQAGPCGSNIVGDNNKTTVKCADETGKAK